MDVHSTTSIASINLKPPHLQILKFLIPYYFKDRFSLTQKKEATVQIVEINSNNIFYKIDEYKKQYPNAFFIIISPHNEVDDNFFIITPPISPKKISDALYYVSDKLSTLTKKKEIAIKKKKSKKTLRTKEKTKQLTLQKKENYSEQQRRKNILEKKYNFYLDLDSYTENLQFDKSKNIESSGHATGKKISKLKKHFDNTAKNNINKSTKNLIEIDKDKLSFMSSRPDIDLRKSNFMSKITYKIEDYLQGSLVKLYNSNNFNTLLTSYCSITYQAENHTAYINVNNRTLQSIASIGALSTHYSLVNIDTLKRDKKIQWEDADIILWKVTIWSSRGRLSSGSHNIDQTFTLMNWPNFTRLMMIPYTMEIAALWVDKPISLRNSITALNVPQRYIFSLYSAAMSLNLILFEKKENKGNKLPSNLAKPSNNNKSKRKNIFGKLLTFFKPDNIKDI
jgi:hypothetical protein